MMILQTALIRGVLVFRIIGLVLLISISAFGDTDPRRISGGGQIGTEIEVTGGDGEDGLTLTLSPCSGPRTMTFCVETRSAGHFEFEDCDDYFLIDSTEWTISPEVGPFVVTKYFGYSCIDVTFPTNTVPGDYTIKVKGDDSCDPPGEKTDEVTIRVIWNPGCGCPPLNDSPPIVGRLSTDPPRTFPFPFGGPEPTRPIGDVNQALASVHPTIQLGRYAFGKPVGELAIHEKYPTNLLATPGTLAFLFGHGTNYQCEVITNTAGIRQVRAPEGLANVVTNTTYKYSVEIYPLAAVSTNKDGNGLYTVSGAPLTTIIIENPDGAASTNRLQITDGDSAVSLYQFTTNGWDLVRGGGLRRDCKTTLVTNDLRIVTDEVVGSAGVEQCCVRKYQQFDFGERLMTRVEGVGANQRTNFYEYFTSPSVLTGLTYQIINADGSWQRFEYNTNRLKTNEISGFLDHGPTSTNALVRNIEYRYGTNAAPGAGDTGKNYRIRPRLKIEYVKGIEVSRLYKLYFPFEKREIRCANPGALWNDASNLVTTYKWYSSGNNSNRLKSVEHPSGVMELFDYGLYVQTDPVAVMYGTNLMYRTNIVAIGQPDAGKTTIVDGTRTITVLGRVGQVISSSTVDIVSGVTNAASFYSDFDPYNRARRITYIDGTHTGTDQGCCGPTIVTNREGMVITYYQDILKNQAASKQNGIIITNMFDAGGRVIKTVRVGTNGNQITMATYGYDVHGNRIAETNALGHRTTFAEGITNFLLTRTTTLPDGGTRIESYYRDGQLRQITGTAAHPVRYEHGTEQDAGVWRLFAKTIKLDGNGDDTSEWTKEYIDMLGRRYKTVFADGNSRQSYFNVKGQLVKETDPDGVTTLFAYDALGERTVVAQDLNRDGIINTNGTDRLQQTAHSFVTNGATIFNRRSTYVWAIDNSSASNLWATTDESVTGLHTWNSRNGLTNKAAVKFAGTGNRYATNTAPDGSFAVSHVLNGLLQSNTRYDASGNQLARQTFHYDAHGRQYASVDARNGVTYFSYDDGDRLVSTTSPLPGTGAGVQTTTFEHDWAGRTIRTVHPDGASVTNEYLLTGELKKTYGSRTYPVQYSYDAQGRRTNMITWKNFAADTGKAITTWRFDARGSLTNKLYNGETNGPSYTYTLAGRLRTRTWARGVVTTYHTNALGEVVATSYSDGTPGVTNTFDRLGRVTSIVDASGNRTRTYDGNSQLIAESYSSIGALNGMTFHYTNDAFQRRTALSFYATNTILFNHLYAYDGASRMASISDGTYKAEYSYLANSPLISQILYRSNTTARMTTTKTYDFLNRLTAISSQPSAAGATPISYAYAYNDANQRVRVNIDDGSFWLYEYDSLGQLVSGKRYWSDWTPVAGQQHEYTFDDIGNRTSTKAGGDASGAGLRSANYTANALNQYTSRDVPAYLNVFGIAHPNSTLTVNSSTPYRKGEFYWKELNVDNSAAAQWRAVTNIASLGGTNQTNTGNLFLPKTAETFTYDLDGNLTSDGRWTNRWDGENRLIEMTSHVSGPSESRKALQFGYDSQSRRFSKVVSNWTGSAWTNALDERFLYDGWNLAAVVNGTNAAIIKSFLWGLDLSGSLRGVGGVGGLLCFRQHSGAQMGNYFTGFDGNGNVTALIDSSGTVSARYEYDPFGQTVRASGNPAGINPVRFSSKYIDEETDYLYYGFRYLNPNSGRWFSRDPIGESGAGLYDFVGNDSASRVDLLGLKKCGVQIFEVHWSQRDEGAHAFGFSIDTWIVFKHGVEFDHRCCHFRQEVEGGFYIERDGNELLNLVRPWHDDGYSRISDFGPYDDTHFRTIDKPGPRDPGLGFLPTDFATIWFRAKQTVYSDGTAFGGFTIDPPCDCEVQGDIQYVDHTGYLTGVVPRQYDKVPFTLTGSPAPPPPGPVVP